MAAPRLTPHDSREFKKLLEWVAGKSSILEVGSRFGYPLVALAQAMLPGARVVSLDLPDAEGWNDSLSAQAIYHLRQNIQKLKSLDYDAHLIEGDSHDPENVAKAKALGPYDVVFIDGDHSYEGVKMDWENYGPMGKAVIFHDIRRPVPPENTALEVWRLWDELKHLNTESFIADGSKMGVGLIRA